MTEPQDAQDRTGRRLLLVYAVVFVAGVTGFFMTRSNPDLKIITNICGFVSYGTFITFFGTWIMGFAKERKK